MIAPQRFGIHTNENVPPTPPLFSSTGRILLYTSLYSTSCCVLRARSGHSSIDGRSSPLRLQFKSWQPKTEQCDEQMMSR
jgi:hypothetical protein